MQKKLFTSALALFALSGAAIAEDQTVTLKARDQFGQETTQTYTLSVTTGGAQDNLWIYIPSNSSYEKAGAVPGFWVSKYEVKGNPATPAAGQTSDLYTWANCRISCQANGPGYDMIKESQWNRIAHDMLNQPENWTGAAVGAGKLFYGIAGGAYGGGAVVASSSDDANGYLGAVTGTTNYQYERRTMLLDTGHALWDFAGGRADWTYADDGRTYAGSGLASYQYAGSPLQWVELNSAAPPASNVDIKPGGSYTNAAHNAGGLVNPGYTSSPIARGAQRFDPTAVDVYGRGIFKITIGYPDGSTGNGCRCALNINQ